MKTKSQLLPTMLLLVAAFPYLFYDWAVGINVFLFDGALLLLLLRVRPELAQRASFRWAVAGLLPAAVSIAVVHSTTSLLAHTASLLLLIGFAQERELRYLWYGLLLGVFSLFAGPLRALDRRGVGSAPSQQGRRVTRWLRQGVFPLLIMVPFFILYGTGSDHVLSLVFDVCIRLAEFVQALSLFPTVGLALLGVLLMLSVFLAGNELDFRTKEDKLGDVLPRRRRPRRRRFRLTALVGEYRRGILTLLLLNWLIGLTNLTDLRFVWLDTAALSPQRLSQYVHAGTTSLVISILLAMGVVLFYFRGNLNFYRRNRLLRRLTYLWLAQNAFLALSVGVRNWHYVSAYGLAYGRVQIAFVLLLILVGLYTLYRKVRHTLSLSFLFQANGLALWLFLIAFGAVNWPGVITRVNLTQARSQVDWEYLIDELDERNLFLLEDEARKLPSSIAWDIRQKARRAREEHRGRDWRAWNYPDWRNEVALARGVTGRNGRHR